MNKNTLTALIFLLVLVAMFWIMPDQKVDTIGDFFEKIISPIGVPLSISLAVRLGILKGRELNRDKDP